MTLERNGVCVLLKESTERERVLERERDLEAASYALAAEDHNRERQRADRAEAENTRLRGLIAQVEFAAGGYTMRNPNCPWCMGAGVHNDSCPAFSARGEVRR
jgi:hypothetical protein